MAEKEFFIGEEVTLERRSSEDNLPEIVREVILGRVTSLGTSYCSYYLKGSNDQAYLFEHGDLYALKDVNLTNGTDTRKEWGRERGSWQIKRSNLSELREGFPSALEAELSVVRRIAQTGNETQKAATLASVRNLTCYLSSEIDAAYKEAARFAQESDETGRAAALATLRNLNAYLEERSRPKS